MDKKSTEELKAKLLEISEFVSRIDPSLRPTAIEMLQVEYFGAKYLQENQDVKDHDQSNHDAATRKGAPTELAEFVKAYDHKKPKDNVLLLVGWLYSTYGVCPLAIKKLNDLADSCGLVVPERLDNTMRRAKVKNKNLFAKQDKGWKLTVSGEIYLQDTYKLMKGNKNIPKD